VNRESVIAQFDSLLPLAVQWAMEQEQRILRQGAPLLPHEIEDAKAIGVRDPERVRLLAVKIIARPENLALRAACDAINFLTPETRGLTLGHGIFIREDCGRDRALIAHELVHTAQYERLGGIEPFLKKYLTECLTIGYADSPLETEAVSIAVKLFATH
jgi:Domain of unknown function (DUF4157)